MTIILHDSREAYLDLLPLTYTRPIACQRIGIDTIAEKWKRLSGADVYFDCAGYLKPKFGDAPKADKDTVTVYSNIIPTATMVEALRTLPENGSLWSDDVAIGWKGDGQGQTKNYDGEVLKISSLPDIFLLNDKVLRSDFEAVTLGQTGRQPDASVTVIGNPSQLFIHPDAGDVQGCIINVKTGPVYIGPHAQVMEGACLRGPIALCSSAVVRMGAKVYGATTLGPWCKIGGEVDNAVLQAYSNKAHDGYLGNAVIGEWCNLGAGCVASNLKNDYTPIRQWNYRTRRFERTTLQFCGLVMGDHSKTGVNTMLNTATVLGVGVNIHGSGFPRPFVASFQEGSTAGFNDVTMQKFFTTAERAMARRGVELSPADKDILMYIHDYSEDLK